MATANGTGLTPPYVSFTTLKSFLSRLKENTVPTVLDGAVFAGMDGTRQSQLRGALRFLELMDDAKRSTVLLGATVEAIQTGDWPLVLGALINDSYSELLKNCKLESTTPKQLETTLETTYGIANNVARKALTFLVQAAQEAKMPLSSYLINRPRGGKGVKRTRRRENGASSDPSRDTGTTDQKMPRQTNRSNGNGDGNSELTAADLVTRLPIAGMQKAEQDAVWLLVLYLKQKEAKADEYLDDAEEETA
ncbi:MAG TPA: hypothetical protein VGQ65_06865 [Thermoanaerobaculia bacterium]|jgi:hypothetical protein|nr:hypothetical protein [Thermoanaerobaculia bacterium]